MWRGWKKCCGRRKCEGKRIVQGKLKGGRKCKRRMNEEGDERQEEEKMQRGRKYGDDFEGSEGRGTGHAERGKYRRWNEKLMRERIQREETHTQECGVETHLLGNAEAGKYERM